MSALIALALLFVVLAFPLRLALARCDWTARTPRAAIVLWQATALALLLTLALAAIRFVDLATPSAGPRRVITDFTAATATHAMRGALTPNELFALTAAGIISLLSLIVVATHLTAVRRTRERQRLLVDLVAIEHRSVTGAVVVENDVPAAYVIPGRRARVVLTSAALEVLDEGEIGAVVAHERAHLRAHHGLVLLPFAALVHALPSSAALAATFDRVAELLEMAADDQAARTNGPRALASALVRLDPTTVHHHAGTDTTSGVGRRIERALRPARGARLLVAGELATAAGVVAMPFVTVLATSGWR